MIEPRQSLLLTERRCSTCRLGGEDVEFLLAYHRPHLQILPTRQPDTYQVCPRGYAGVITAPHTQIVIRPKIPTENLCYLLDVPPPATTDRYNADLAPGDGVVNLLAVRLAQLMDERTAAGLKRGYTERSGQTSFVQGQVDVGEQMRTQAARKDRLACRFDDFTVDIEINQIPKAVATRLLDTPLVADSARPALQQALSGFDEVSSVRLPVGADLPWPELFAVSEDYREPLNLCRLILESLVATAGRGAEAFPGLLLNMERAFEDFCARQLRDFFHGASPQSFDVATQQRLVPHVVQRNVPKLHFQPDVLIQSRRSRAAVLVIDTKWKRSPLARSDLYQILAYCAAVPAPQGMLVYPGSRNGHRRYDFAAANQTLHLDRLRLTGSLADCRAATKCWLQRVHELCKGRSGS